MRALNYLTQALGIIAGIAVAMMMMHIMADVLGKYLLNKPVPSTAEVVANYYMIASVFLSIAYVEARGSAISVDIIYEQASPYAQWLMQKIGQVITLLFYAGLSWFSLNVAMRAYRVNEAVDGLWRITTWPAKFILPVGMAIACLVLILRIFGFNKSR